MIEPGDRRAGLWIRFAAAAVDGAVALALTLPLSTTFLGSFFASRAVVTLRIGQPGTLWKGPIPMVLGAVGEVTYLLPFVAAVVWSLDVWGGATVGKRLFGLRVATGSGGRAGVATRLRRFAVQAVGAWGWTLSLLAGSWILAVVATLGGGVAMAASLLALGPSKRALHDRIAGTVVVRKRGRWS